MAFELKLKSEWQDPETLKVSWQEPRLSDALDTETIKTPVGYACAVGLVASVILPFITGQWLFALLFPVSVVAIAIEANRAPSQKSVTFGRNETRFLDKVVPTNRITRISIDDKLQWANLSPQEKEKSKSKTQILIWLDDEQPFEVSRNNITQETNFKIRNALDNALQELRKKTEQDERDETQGKSGDFGVPDY